MEEGKNLYVLIVIANMGIGNVKDVIYEKFSKWKQFFFGYNFFTLGLHSPFKIFLRDGKNWINQLTSVF